MANALSRKLNKVCESKNRKQMKTKLMLFWRNCVGIAAAACPHSLSNRLMFELN